jgi:hypothetical protein
MSDKASPSNYAPSVPIRLLCWFGIYFVAQLPLIYFAFAFWMFPLGLASYIFPLLGWLGSLQLEKEIAATLAYTFYLWHLILSLAVRSKKIFWFLMIVLIIVVCLNFSSCSNDMAGLGQIKG